ncbi:hypothetical protein V8G54_033490 [Vigna mungo]|uniref:Protein kinase domain-containing protein n=1 Tax=Vigna mungo TaxID=3915 RepID=A0AAQ3MNJ2_VIGMU
MEERWRFITWLKLLRVLLAVLSLLFTFTMEPVRCSTLSSEGLALQKMKEKEERDPLGSLWSWNREVVDHCSHGKVVSLKLLQAANDADDEKKPLSPSPSPSPFPSTLSPLSEPFSPSQSPSDSPTSPELSPSPSPSLSSFFFSLSPSPSPVPAPTPHTSPPPNPPMVVSTPPHSNWVSMPSPASSSNSSSTNQHAVIIWSIVGGFSFILVSVVVFLCFRSNKVVTVKPWATGLSGQLQKAFLTGVPSLKKTELEVACEYFSNIIGSLPDGTVYKGTLSSGVEIAVVSSAVTSSHHWSKNLETQFRKKIAMLSRVNHKNFVNLIGYCEENKPFTRMMVFEYAPNGTLFEHLHIREAERLDWGMRIRIAMGIAYCLEHMHQLTPPIAYKSILSSSVYLTEDYAAKLSDFSFWTDIVSTKKGSEAAQLLETAPEYIKANVYSFGVLLFELITGRIPFAVENGLFEDWAAEYIKGQPLRDVVDSNLNSLQENEIDKWEEVINSCVDPDPEKRPTMREITSKLKEITTIGPDGATPKASPLWWAEIEIMSTDLSSDVNP